MKRLFLQLILTLIVGICSAQSEHMKFKGVPMEGTLQSFTNKLAAKGYTPIGTQDGVSILKGEFAGYKDCTIGAVSDKSGMVCKVAVMFPAMEKWGDLELCYKYYKSMLTEKYGDPKDCVEKFHSRYTDDDNSKLHEVKMDRCKYYCTFDGDNGQIQLEITQQNMTCYVMLSYYDNANQEQLRKQIMDDL